MPQPQLSKKSATALATLSLLVPNARAAAPEVTTDYDYADQTMRLSVEYDTAHAQSLNIQFSRDLRTWRPEAECGCLQAIATGRPSPNNPGRLINEYTVIEQAVDPEIFFRAVGSLPAPPYKLSGLNTSFYILPEENPNRNVSGQITREELEARMAVVAPYTEWIRSYGTAPDLQPMGAIAHGLGLKAAIGAWLGRDLAENERQVNALIDLALRGEVDVAIVGSEVLLRGDLSEDQLIAYMDTVRTKLRAAGISIPVTTAEVYGVLLSRPRLIEACDEVIAHFYPFWEGQHLDCSMAYLDRAYEQLKAASGTKEVKVGETGWPSCGERKGEAVPSPENAASYMLTFVSWARAKNVKYFAFSAMDEGWKVSAEGVRGKCWGMWDAEGNLKPGRDAIFRGETVPPERWSICASSAKVIDLFTSPDQYGTNLRDLVLSGVTKQPGQEVRVNGTPLTSSEITDKGDFAKVVQLSPGVNQLEISIFEPGGTAPILSTTKFVNYDPSASMANKRLLFVNFVNDLAGPAALNGTLVIDPDGDVVLGYLPNLHVRGISPSGAEIYMASGEVLSTDDFRVLRRLPLRSPATTDSFLVSPKGDIIISGADVFDVASNTLITTLPTSIATGSSWAGASYPGGAAISPDGKSIFFGNAVNKLNLETLEITPTGISIVYMSDMTVSEDGKVLAISTYSYGSGSVLFYDTETFALLGRAGGIGDFSGEVVFTGPHAVVGSAGNPAWNDGYISLIDPSNFQVLSQARGPLADNVVASDRGEIFVSAGTSADGVRPSLHGVDVLQVIDGQLTRTKTFNLGLNRWIPGVGRPSDDQIRKMVYKR